MLVEYRRGKKGQLLDSFKINSGKILIDERVQKEKKGEIII